LIFFKDNYFDFIVGVIIYFYDIV